jgi:alpha-L-fucosidase
MAWWREARFGMFIHWGVYSVPAGTYNGKRIDGIGEWIMQHASIPIPEYEKFAAQFNPVKFDADEWVSLAKNAGVKYIVITSKHHDGFCLWDSKVTQWDIMDATPFKRDILKELSQACKKQGVTLCFYHSIMDWHHPDAQGAFYPNYDDNNRSNPNFDRYVETYLKPQLAELVANYGPLGVLWFDGEWVLDWTEPKGKDLYAYVRGLQPTIIINNRVGKGRKGMEGLSKGDEYAGDFGTPEQQVPPSGLPGVDWETCMTMNDTWGYKSYDQNWKSTEELIHTLVDVASKGGNFLLNVGPTSEGLIPQASVERLQEMGKWMAINSESIYGTTASPIGRP